MNYADANARLAAQRQRIADIRAEMRATLASRDPQPVQDYCFTGPDGAVRLSALFGDFEDLIVIHNMGRACANCTLWADGYNGLYPHLVTRAAFVVTSPDAPADQQRFAASRGWRFPLLSHAGSSFATDMGYGSATTGWRPGVSVFRRDTSGLVRVSDSSFSPGDDFCTLWHFFDLLPGGAGTWHAARPATACCTSD